MTSTAQDLEPRQSVVLFSITCPPWCTVTAGQHADDLWDMEGHCVHHGPSVEVRDPAGYQEPLTPTRFNSPVSVAMTTMAAPNGQETASPLLYLNDRELSLEQALNLADELRRQVELYRATGGVA